MEDIIKPGETQEQKPSSKKKLMLFLIMIICLAIVLVGVIFLPKIFAKKEWACVDGKWVRQYAPELPQKPTPAPDKPCKGALPATSTGEPINPKNNLARAIPLDGKLGYGCSGPGSFRPELIKEPDSIWNINKDGTETIVGLGKYKINLLERTVVDVKKIWFYFTSNELGRAEDKWYGVESSYVSGMIFSVNGYKKEINLGGDEYMFIELVDYPLGDFYPYLKSQYVEFEILVKVKCKNIQNNQCIGNNGNSLDYINNADIQTQFRIFALGCEDFTVDLSSSAKLKYEK